MKNTLRLALPLLSLFIFISCNQRNRLADFVQQYNYTAQSPLFRSSIGQQGIITHSNAEIVDREGSTGLKDIKITFMSSLKDGDQDADLYKELIPLTFVNIIQQNKLATEILDRGTKFLVVFSSRDGKTLKELIIDKAKYQELISSEKNGSHQLEGNDQTMDSQVNQILVLLNKGLPVVINKELDASLTNISLNEEDRLLYKVIINSNEANLLKGPDAAILLKDEILRNPNITQLFNKMRRFGVKGITYIYYNKKQQEINKVNIDQEDL